MRKGLDLRPVGLRDGSKAIPALGLDALLAIILPAPAMQHKPSVTRQLRQTSADLGVNMAYGQCHPQPDI